MEAGLIPDHHRVNTSVEFTDKLLQKEIDDFGIHVRRKQPRALPGLRTHSSHHIQIVILRLPHRPWPRASPGPYASQRTLLSEARFVLEPDLHALVGMIRADRFDLCHDVFLKAS